MDVEECREKIIKMIDKIDIIDILKYIEVIVADILSEMEE